MYSHSQGKIMKNKKILSWNVNGIRKPELSAASSVNNLVLPVGASYQASISIH
jgi:hypothetical protein